MQFFLQRVVAQLFAAAVFSSPFELSSRVSSHAWKDDLKLWKVLLSELSRFIHYIFLNFQTLYFTLTFKVLE